MQNPNYQPNYTVQQYQSIGRNGNLYTVETTINGKAVILFASHDVAETSAAYKRIAGGGN